MCSTAVSGERKNLRFLENYMKKNDILFFIVTIVLLSLFSGIVITGIIRNESFCLMIWLVAALLFSIVLGYFILQYLEEKRNIDCKKTQYEKLDKIFEKLKFPADELVDIETVITEKKPNGDKESMVTTKKRNLNAELCKKWIEVVADL